MRAVLYRSYGGPEVVEVGDVPEPHAGPDQVRIAVRGASINPFDWKVMSGGLAGGEPLEGVGRPGWDAAGVVDEVGAGVTDVAVGDEVFGTGSETQAEHAVLDAWARKPAGLDWAAAAGVGGAGETGERILRLLDVREGWTVFVDGGAGGVGAVAVQMAVARGLRVIASAGPGNQDYLRGLGATPVVYGEGVADRVRAAAGAGTVDAVVDIVGRTPLPDLIGLAPEPARVLTIANFSAGDSGVLVTGGGDHSEPRSAMALVADLFERGRLRIETRTFPFDRAREAYEGSRTGHVRGKLVLVP